MFSLFKKKIIIPHVRMTGVIGSVGRFKQGIDLANQQEILKKAFSYKKAETLSISSTFHSPVNLLFFDLRLKDGPSSYFLQLLRFSKTTTHAANTNLLFFLEYI